MTDAATEAIATALDQVLLWSRRTVPMPVSATQIMTLETLRREGPLRVTDLAARQQLSQPGMTILLNRLGNARLAERVADPSDGRATLVRITAAGAALLEQRSAARRARIASEVARLSPRRRAALEAAVEALQALAAEPDDQSNDLSEMTA